jgi:single-stranded-DNA-specific exonuclease
MKSYRLRGASDEVGALELSVYPDIVRDMLISRGIKTLSEAEKFLNPSFEKDTFDPFLIHDMDRTVSRILEAIVSNEKIAIWSDYDHDGIPGAVILFDFFKKINFHNFVNYIPHRYLEGYGLNVNGIDKLKSEGVKLMITVDVGITDILPIDHANELGIDVIVTDHHLPIDTLPKAYAILNSKKEGDTYPDKMLCGAAVSYKLVKGLLARGNFEIKEGWDKWLLDMVGISTIADMVPLRNENRVLAYYGIKVLKKSPRPGLLSLFRKNKINQRFINEDDIGFTVAPRINAASRMGEPMLAFDLLSNRLGPEVVDSLSSELDKLNSSRKGIVSSMVKESKKILSLRESIPEVIVMGNPLWRPGLLGLVANNLMEEHSKPVFLWGKEGGENLRGSCRSDGSVNLVKLMAEVKEGTLLDFGGHAFSGGFEVSYSEIHFLEDRIIEAYNKVRNEGVSEDILVDRIISVDDVTEALYRDIEKFAPFGIENEKPIFMFQDITIFKIKKFGKNSEHLEVGFEKNNGGILKAVEFFSDRGISEGDRITLVANIEKSYFGMKPELRLRVIDII